jgi:hypothetical protein
LNSLATLPFTRTSVAVSPDLLFAGGVVNITATVSGLQGNTPGGGTVSFFEVDESGNQLRSLGSAPLLVGGVAWIATESFTAGPHTVLAEYSGDFENAGSAGFIGFDVLKGNTISTLNIDPVSTLYGEQVTLTVTVMPQGAAPTLASAGVGVLQELDSPPALGGTVTFYDSQSPITTVAVGTNRRAVLVTSTLTAGSHVLSAVYNGDSNYQPSTSNTVTLDVTPTALAPTVVSLRRFGFHWKPTRLVLDFSEPMNEARAEDLANYRLVDLGRDRRAGTADDRSMAIGAATYDAASRTVKLAPRRRLPLHRRYQLTVVGTPPGGLTATTGTSLDGAGMGQAGTDYVAIFGRETLVRPARGIRGVELRRR